MYANVHQCTFHDMTDKPEKAARYELGIDLDHELEDLSAGYRGAPPTGLVRDAVRAFIDRCLDAEPEVRKRYEASRKARLRAKDSKLTIVSGDQD